MKKLCFSLFLLALTLTSCSNDNEQTAPVVTDPNSILVKKTIDTSPSPNPQSITNYNYSGNKLLNTIDNEGGKDVYTYTSDLITKIEFFRNNILLSTQLFVYNSNKKLIEHKYFNNYNNSEGLRKTFVHNANNTISCNEYSGDFTTQNQFESSAIIYDNKIETTSQGIIYKDFFTFDNKNNPYKNILGFDKISFIYDTRISFSNYTQNVVSSYSIDPATNQQINPSNSVITYNTNNFPILDVTTSYGDENKIEYFY